MENAVKLPTWSNSTYAAAAAAAAAVTAATFGTAYCAYKCYGNRKPTRWTEVGTLARIHAYPIKSCGGIELETADCTPQGLKSGWLRDRYLMIVDKDNNFVTARAFPELLRVDTNVRRSVLTLSHDDMETIHIDLAEVIALQKPFTAVVWSVEVPVLDCGNEAGAWFSKLLNKSDKTFRLVYYASQRSREIKMHSKFFKLQSHDMGALPDEASYLLVNEASVDDLDDRVGGASITARHFRPNLLLRGAAPYAEDKWRYVKIGENIFEIVKPCTRCIMTTIDPETGVKHPRQEPLATLKTYREIADPELRRAAGSSPCMGVMLSLRWGSGAPVTANMPVYVAEDFPPIY